MRKVLQLLLLTYVLSQPLRAEEIDVFAAASLTDVLKEIGASFESETGDHCVFNFAGSNVLARQIDESAPCDIFISADEVQMDRVDKGGHLTAGTRKDLLSNTLVVVVPNDSKLTISSPSELTKLDKLALADPKSVPAGVYSREYLTKLKLWEQLEPKVVPTENVRACVAAVESGNVDAGFVYATDARVSKKVKVIYQVPPAEAPPISYPAALLKDAPHRAEAEKLFEYLTNARSTKILEKAGFIVKSQKP